MKPPQVNHSSQLNVVVAGVPRSYQAPQPEGHWLNPNHVQQITSVSSRISLVHLSEKELLEGKTPPANADVLLVEASGEEPYHDEISAPHMKRLVTPDLKWLQSCSSGVGHILNLGLLSPHISLTNAAGVHANALAESIMAAILAHAKKLHQRLDNQRNKSWQELHCTELTGKTLVIIGAGKIGCTAARLARAFGLKTIGIRSSGRPAENFDKMVTPHSLHQVLALADYVVIACPLTEQTRGMLGPAQFSSMKPGAYLINIARGKIIDEDALLEAIASGQINGAFLDALSVEPLPEDHLFWTTPGITIIPHDSHSSPLIGDNIINVFTANLQRFIADQPLVNLVDPAKGY